MTIKKRKRGQRSAGRRWTQWKEPEAREALAAWARSGLSSSAFCASEGYSDSRLRYWSQRLGKRPAAPRPAVSFVPVTLADSAVARHIELERDGVVVRVREDLDVTHVARLAAALAARVRISRARGRRDRQHVDTEIGATWTAGSAARGHRDRGHVDTGIAGLRTLGSAACGQPNRATWTARSGARTGMGSRQLP